MLALEAGRVVPASRLIDGLWGEDPPDTAQTALHVHISTLRRALGMVGQRIVTRTPGYLLDVPESAVDVLAARSAIKGQALDGAALLAIESALALDPLADVQGLPFALTALPWITELRWSVTEQRVEAQLADGTLAIADVEALTAAQPYRERLWRALMLVQYRAGRAADALDSYRTVAHVLRSELGLEPGPALAALQAAVLANDESLLPEDGRPPLVIGSPLPGRTACFVGRAAELDELVAAFGRHRLVTVTGAGGVGKTTTVVQALHSRTAAPDGRPAAFVDLSAVHDPSLVVPTIAAVCGISTPGEDPVATFADSLGDRPLLLVLDTMEHVVAAATAIGELLARLPGLRIIAVSRVPLRIAEEVVVTLAPMSDTDARELFTTTIGGPRGGEAAAIAEICLRVQNVPLAIELAAARARTLGLRAMSGSLGELVTQTAGTRRDRSSRHSSLAATVDWSVDLLSEPARRLLDLAATFAAPAAVGELGAWWRMTGHGKERADWVALLEQLTDASLVTVDGGKLRLLDVIGECVRKRQERSGARQGLARLHMEWVLRRCRELTPSLYSTDDAGAVAELVALLPELRTAFDWGLVHEPQEAAELLGMARRGWVRAGFLGELVRLLQALPMNRLTGRPLADTTAMLAVMRKITVGASPDEMLAAVDAVRGVAGSEVVLVNALVHTADLLSETGDRRSLDLAAEAVQVAQTSPDVGSMPLALEVSSHVATALGDVDAAVEFAGRGVEVSRQYRLVQLPANLAAYCAALAAAGRPEEALVPGLEAIAHARQTGSPTVLAETVIMVADALQPADAARMAPDIADAVALWVAVGSAVGAGECCHLLARLAAADQPEPAARLLAAAIRFGGEEYNRSAIIDKLRSALGEWAFAQERAAGAVLGPDDVIGLAREVAAVLAGPSHDLGT